MTLSINQPAFFPWLGYFHRILNSELHVVLDHVQLEKNSYTNRNKIKTPTGAHWLTIPVVTSGKFGNLPIASVEIFQDKKWQKKICETIRQFYSKAPYFTSYFNDLAGLINADYVLLNDLLKKTNNYFLEALDIKTPLQYSSDIKVPGAKSELVLNICKHFNCTTYISGPLGKGYLDTDAFVRNGISVQYHNFQHPVYKQMHGSFVPNLSVIDLLFNEGPASKDILKETPFVYDEF